MSLSRVVPESIRVRFRARGDLRKVIWNTGWLFGDRAIRMCVGVVVAIWVARYLGPVQFGQLNFALAIVGLFSSIALLGLDQIVVCELLRDASKASETLGTAFVLRVLSSLAAIMFAGVLVSVLRPEDPLALGLVVILSVCMVTQSFDVIDLWFQSLVEAKYSVIAKNVAFVGASVLRVALVVHRAPLLYFALAGLVEASLGAVALCLSYRWRAGRIAAWRCTTARAKELLSQSWPFILAGMAVMIYMRIGQIVLGSMSGNNAVGTYAAAARISEMWYFVPTAISTSLMPSMVKIRETDEGLYYKRLQKIFVLMAGLGYAVAIPVSIFSGKIVTLLYGPTYGDAAGVLAVHVWAGVFVTLGVARVGFWDTPQGMMRFSMMTTVAGGAVSVALNFLLIPYWGAIGSAVATLVSYSCAATWMCFLHPKGRRIGKMMLRALCLSSAT